MHSSWVSCSRCRSRPARLSRAGDDGDQKKQDREWKKLEEKQKKGGEKPSDDKSSEKSGDKSGEKKPAESSEADEDPAVALAKILDLMKEVESRLEDSVPDEKTLLDQKKVVEAMKFGDKARTALDDLIRKLEEKT